MSMWLKLLRLPPNARGGRCSHRSCDDICMRHEHHDKGTRQGSMCVTLCISPLLCFKNGGSFSHDVSSDVPTGQSLACGLLTSHFQITWDPRQWKRATRHKSNQEELTKKLRSDMDQTGAQILSRTSVFMAVLIASRSYLTVFKERCWDGVVKSVFSGFITVFQPRPVQTEGDRKQVKRKIRGGNCFQHNHLLINRKPLRNQTKMADRKSKGERKIKTKTEMEMLD